MERLDKLLARAVSVAQEVYGRTAEVDPFRGLYINDEELKCLFARKPGEPLFSSIADIGIVELPNHDSRLSWLQGAFGLSQFDMEVILLCLAPEMDLRYERLYAYLQDDVTRRRPTVDLVLNLLCENAKEKIAGRSHFSSQAPLILSRLVQLLPEPNQVKPPILAHHVTLDPQVVCFLLGQDDLDTRLALYCKLFNPTTDLQDVLISKEFKKGLSALVDAVDKKTSLKLYFSGSDSAIKRATAEAVAKSLSKRFLIVDLFLGIGLEQELETILELMFREALFHDAVLYVEGADLLRGSEHGACFKKLLNALGKNHGPVILAGAESWPQDSLKETGLIPVLFESTDFSQRRACWETVLVREGQCICGSELDHLAGRFPMTFRQIENAVISAKHSAFWRASVSSSGVAETQTPSIDNLYEAARAQYGYEFTGIAQKIHPKYVWEDIVLPEDAAAQLHEICQQVAFRQQVINDWKFDRKFSSGKGVNALFAGPSGSGKTMAAEVIANELKLDLYKIDLSGVVSKYIGETEKNLNRIFSTAENANCILFFDEADALFGKRSEVRDSHDRYANIEISYLLQKMEQHEGITILASNLRQNMDEAFVRRLSFVVHFPFPDEINRRSIWDRIWPIGIPLDENIDVDYLCREFKFSGGQIKNIALAASFLAAANGGIVTMDHVFHAVRREYQKIGKIISPNELSKSYEERRVGFKVDEKRGMASKGIC